MNGSLGAVGGVVAVPGEPSSIGQRPLASNSSALKYLRPAPLSDASSAMSCQGTPTIPARNTLSGARGGAPAAGANKGFGTCVLPSDCRVNVGLVSAVT